MKSNGLSITRVLGIVAFFVVILMFSPVVVLAATNYGDGTYGGGLYNVGDTPAPTVTPGNNNSGSSSSSSSSSTSPSGCNDSATTGTPDLFEIHTTKSSATLYFAPPVMPYSNFYVAYSRKTDVWEYGTQFNQGQSSGVITYTINALQPNTKYYFKVRPGNGCAAGNSGNTMAATTTSSKQTRTYYKSFVTAVVQSTKNFFSNLFPSKNTNTPQPTATTIAEPTNIQNPTQEPTQTTPPKSKFCILWWCF